MKLKSYIHKHDKNKNILVDERKDFFIVDFLEGNKIIETHYLTAKEMNFIKEYKRNKEGDI